MIAKSACAALVLTLLAAAPVLAAPAPTSPAAKPFMVGKAKVFALADMLNVLPNDGSVVGVGIDPKDITAVLFAAGAPTDKITLGIDALLVEEQGHVVLLDTGLGPKVGGVLPQSLALAGVKPEQVTDVLITHTHGDHVGGLIHANGSLAFPNATIRMSAPEWDYMQAKGDPALVAAIRGKVEPFALGAQVIPGIRSVNLPGHTPGHSGYEIISGNERLLDVGDLAHSAIVSLAKPDWAIAYDGDKVLGRNTRKAELATLAASHELIFAPHFPYPGVGYVVKAGSSDRNLGVVVKQGDGYRFQAAKP